MSRIGKKEIIIPEGVTVEQSAGSLVVSGPLGKLDIIVHPKTQVKIDGSTLTVNRKGDDKLARSVHGLTRTLIANMVEGVTKGFEKQLEIVGVGYRAASENNKLTLKVGYSHEIEKIAPDGITFEVKKNIISIKGIDKQRVGQTAAEIREIRKPEPYKGKGIKYVGEHIIRKVGKAVKGAGA